MTILTEGPWLSALAAAALLLVIFRRPLVWAGKLLVRSAVGLGFLALWAASGLGPGLTLGVNVYNALTLGLLGVPGLGLLFLLRWLGT